jgi:hypothetical protein
MSGTVTYNLFRQGRDPAILCAVPNDKPVPAFIRGRAWSFERVIEVGGDSVEGFEPGLATAAADLNGFYLFLAFGRAFDESMHSIVGSRDLRPVEAIAA